MDKAAIKLGGAKRKNGHKMNCDCHICENMKNKAKRGGYAKDVENEELKQMGGSKKKNGHKPDCGCPICKNMSNAKKSMKSGKGGKKNNGHKMNCGCPICKNMSKKSRKGGAISPDTPFQPDKNYDDLENIPEATTLEVPQDANQSSLNETTVRGNAPFETATEDELNDLSSSYTPTVNGGRKRKTIRKSMKKSMKKRGNGHKANCGCPICKNMRKGSKTRRL